MRLQPLYSCDEQCGRNATSPGEPRLRRAARCSLPDFDASTWDPTADREAARIAVEQAENLAGLAVAQGVHLDFELERDGCPQGWALSRYASSVAAYKGQRSTDSPVRAPNMRLWRRAMRDREEPTELLEAVALLEAYEDGAFAQFSAILKG